MTVSLSTRETASVDLRRRRSSYLASAELYLRQAIGYLAK